VAVVSDPTRRDLTGPTYCVQGCRAWMDRRLARVDFRHRIVEAGRKLQPTAPVKDGQQSDSLDAWRDHPSMGALRQASRPAALYTASAQISNNPAAVVDTLGSLSDATKDDWRCGGFACQADRGLP
jgi:hypothetical protein